MSATITARPVSNAIRKEQIPLIKALDGIRSLQPVHWQTLVEGLRGYLEPEMLHMVRCPPELLPVAQGRAQIADDLLQIVATCGQLSERLRTQEAAAKAQAQMQQAQKPLELGR